MLNTSLFALKPVICRKSQLFRAKRADESGFWGRQA
jgi:hypothetical protein